MEKLYIVMVGLPARGKSTVAKRLREGLCAENVETRIFNNGDLRRVHFGNSSAMPEFYHPDNQEGRTKREELALANIRSAKVWLEEGGSVAILDATNASRSRREVIERELQNAPILYIECVTDDPELLRLSVQRKAKLPELAHLSVEEAVAAFTKRVEYYHRISVPLEDEGAYVRVDSFRNEILKEQFSYKIPYYLRIRDILISDWVRELYLARHGESLFNIESRIGGDAPLTAKGRMQAAELATHFQDMEIPYIFTSYRKRALETAAPIAEMHPEAILISLTELDEIDAGVCDGMRYEDIRRTMPKEFAARAADKYHYSYPQGEGYASMRARVERGLRKALFLSGGVQGTVIIGHQAVNRTILSLFLFRRTADVPYIYVPQNQCFHIEATHQRKLFEMVRFSEQV